jgi:hypothetical protein
MPYTVSAPSLFLPLPVSGHAAKGVKPAFGCKHSYRFLPGCMQVLSTRKRINSQTHKLNHPQTHQLTNLKPHQLTNSSTQNLANFSTHTRQFLNSHPPTSQLAVSPTYRLTHSSTDKLADLIFYNSTLFFSPF